MRLAELKRGIRRRRLPDDAGHQPMPAATRLGLPPVPGGHGGDRPRLVVALTFPVNPPLGGGQVRAYNLYRGLAKVFDIELVTLAAPDVPQRRTQLAPGLWEHRVPKSRAHAERELALEREAGTVVTDIAMADLYHHTPDYLQALREAARGAYAAVACHPYAFPALREVTDIPLWYEAQDVEALLKTHVLGASDAARRLLADAERVERECCQQAELIWACSAEDGQELISRYGGDPDRMLVVPNGAALDELSFVGVAERQANQRRLRLEGNQLATFIASWHQPNVVGARRLLEIAERVPEVDFLILGSVGMALAGDRLPDNVQLTGTVSLGFKQAVLAVADVALNPVTTGSGTNLKMLDYFGSGIPVISTAFGARGLGVRAGEHYLSAELPEFKTALRTLGALPIESLERLVGGARSLVQERLSWTVITDELLRVLRERSANV